MGIFDFWKRQKMTPLERTIHKLLSKNTLHDDRMVCIESLANEGSEESIDALLRRFELRADKQREDKVERDYVCEVLISIGAAVVEPTRKHLMDAMTIAAPCRVLREVAGDEILADALVKALEHERGRMSFKADKTIRLLECMRGLESEEVANAVIPSLRDFDDSIRNASLQVLREYDLEAVRVAMIEAWLQPEEESKRLKNDLLQVIVERQWPVGDFRQAAEKLLAGGYHLDKKGIIQAPETLD